MSRRKQRNDLLLGTLIRSIPVVKEPVTPSASHAAPTQECEKTKVNNFVGTVDYNSSKTIVQISAKRQPVFHTNPSPLSQLPDKSSPLTFKPSFLSTLFTVNSPKQSQQLENKSKLPFSCYETTESHAVISTGKKAIPIVTKAQNDQQILLLDVCSGTFNYHVQKNYLVSLKLDIFCKNRTLYFQINKSTCGSVRKWMSNKIVFNQTEITSTLEVSDLEPNQFILSLYCTSQAKGNLCPTITEDDEHTLKQNTIIVPVLFDLRIRCLPEFVLPNTSK